MFILITTLYYERNEKRQREYLDCLDNNLNNPDIELIVIFYETITRKDPFLKKLKKRKDVRIVFWNHRPTFREIFSYANKRLEDKKIVLTNGDIYYDPKRGLNLLRDIRLDHLILILTRYNKPEQVTKFLEEYPQKTGVYIQSSEGRLVSQTNGKSVDTWIFKTPIYPDFKCDFRLGTYNCDSYLNHQLLNSFKYEVYNPCLDIVSIHNHDGWSPSKYTTVVNDQGKVVPLSQYYRENIDKGYHPERIPFCRLEHALDRQ